MKATARVQITIEVDADQPWGGEATVDSVWTQAKREAVAKIERMVLSHRGFRLVGTPRVVCVAAEEG